MGSVHLLLPPLRLILSHARLIEFIAFRTALFVVLWVRSLHFHKVPHRCFGETLAIALIIRVMKKCILVCTEISVSTVPARRIHCGQVLQSAENRSNLSI